MKAIETTATINQSGQLTLDESLGFIKPQRLRVIVLISEEDEIEEAIAQYEQEIQIADKSDA